MLYSTWALSVAFYIQVAGSGLPPPTPPTPPEAPNVMLCSCNVRTSAWGISLGSAGVRSPQHIFKGYTNSSSRCGGRSVLAVVVYCNGGWLPRTPLLSGCAVSRSEVNCHQLALESVSQGVWHCIAQHFQNAAQRSAKSLGDRF